MSTVVGDIHAAILARCAAVLPAAAQLRRVFEPDQNDFRHPNMAYAVSHLDGNPSISITRSYTVDQSYEVLLAKRFVDRSSDEDKQTVINDLYESAHLIFKDLVNTKLGLGTSVLNVEQLGFSSPEILSNEVALLRAQVVVKYRQTLT